MTRHRCFPPVVDERTRLLILGSLPGAASLAAGRYYANPRNQFWALVSAAIGVDLVAMDYARRLEALLRNGIGLWDVVAEAGRKGSLDGNIVDAAPNDLVGLLDNLPRLETVAFNGGKAAAIGMPLLTGRSGLRLIRLPSSSPAYTLPFPIKREAWMPLAA